MTIFLWVLFFCGLIVLFIHFNAIANPEEYKAAYAKAGNLGSIMFSLILVAGVLYWEAYLLFITTTQYSQSHIILLWSCFIFGSLQGIRLLFSLLVPQLNTLVITNRSWLFARCLIDLAYTLWAMYLITLG